jgi:hypothetical protein
MRSTPRDVNGDGLEYWVESLTFMSHTHLCLHGLEIIGLAGLSLSAHALPGPLFEPTDSLVDVHVVKDNRNLRLWAKKKKVKQKEVKRKPR